MTKRLFSLAVMMILALAAWADDVTGNEAITFNSAANTGGIYLHGAVFGTDNAHLGNTSGTFTGTTTNWSTSTVLTSSQGASLSSLGNISADATTGAPDGSLAFSHSGAGTLYVVYGATSAADGKFCIATKASSASSYTVTEKAMSGIDYSGPLGTRTDSYTYTLEQASIELSVAGTVYLAGTQPYCIYAILFVPTIEYPAIYGTYDFRTWAEANLSGNVQASINLNNGVMTGSFSDMKDGAENMTLNGAFSITGDAYKLRKNGSTGNANSGLMISKTSGAKLTINRLQAGDWFTITTDVADRLQFATSNTNVHPAGSTETVTQDSYVQSGTVYIATAATTVDVYSKAVGTVYIHKVQISNEDAVSAPVISVDGNNLVTINGGTSLKGEAVKVYYTRDNTDPTTSSTRAEYTDAFTPTKTEIIRAYSVLASDETIASAEAEPVAVRIGTWTGETNVFDFASAANNLIDITFDDTKLDGIKMYGGSSSTNADANFYPISNTDWMTASTGNTATIAWREKGAKFNNGGLVQNGQSYFAIANLTEGQRVQIELVGRLRYRTGVSDTAPVVLNGGATMTTDTYLGTKNAESTIALTIQSGSYMVFLCENSDVVIKKITVLDALPTYTLTVDYDNTKGSVTANNTVLSESYQEGTVVSLLATPDEDYQFVEWTDNEGTRLSLENPYEITITANTSLKAVFKQPTTPAVAITEEKTWTFDGFSTGAKLSGTKVYEFDGLYISGHNSDTSNQATVMAGEASTGIAGNVTKYVNIAGKNNSVTATIDPSTFTTDAIALKTGPGIVEFYDKGKGTNRYFNVFVNGTKYQTEMTQTESANDFQLIRQDAYAATNNVFFSTSDGGHQLYAVKFTPETVSKPTIAANGAITNGSSNLIADANKVMKTYYTTDGTAPSLGSTESTGSIKQEGTFTVKAFTVNSITGTKSEVVEKTVTVTLANNLGTTIPVILVAGQSNTDGRVPVSDLPSDYTGLQNCYWSYCNAQKVYAGSGLSTSYTTEGDFKKYEPLNDGGGGWAYDAVVYNEIGKYLATNYASDSKFYVVKQSKGNTAISPAAGGCGLFWSANPLWLSRNESTNRGGQSLLKAFIGNIDASLKKIAAENPGKETDIKFLMWHQGECDGAGSQGAAYYTQLKALINYVRNYLAKKNSKYSNLPIVLGGIPTVSDQYRAEVENAKQQLANEDVNIYYVPADMITSQENDLLPESTTVHFNAKSAKAFGASVWQTINDNHLLYGLEDGTGSKTAVADILKETVISETTKWYFNGETANTKYSTLTDKGGLYLRATSAKNVTAKAMADITSVTYRDGEKVETSKALYSEMVDRSNWTKYGITAGDVSAIDRSFGINVSEAGTFYAIVAPNTEPTEAQASRTICLVVNGEKVDEVNALEAWNNTNHLAELKYKLDGPGTIFLMGSHASNLLAAKFMKAGEETGAFQVKVTADGGTVKMTSPSGKTLDDYFDKNTEVTLKAETDLEGCSFEKWTGDVPEGADATSATLTLKLDADKQLTAVFRQQVLYDFKKAYEDNPEMSLGMSDDNNVPIYYHRSSDDSDRSGNFNYVTAEPYNSVVSVLSSGMSLTKNGLKVSSNRPFAIHGLKVGDVIRMEFSGSLYYAKHSSKGNELADVEVGGLLENLGEYTVNSVDDTNNYVVFFPSATTTIAQLSINKELSPYTMTDYYISPDGDDANSGIKTSPFKTLKKAQEMVGSKCTVHILPGTYQVANEYMDESNATWNIVFALNTSNVNYIGEVGSNGKRPVFDFSGVEAKDGKRITGFLLTAKNITVKNIETIGILVPKISGDDTQSEFFRLNGANGCTLQNIAAHNGNGIGFYIHGKSRDNLVVDCDAYENVDVINNTGENNDGFGCHVGTGYTGNKFLRCRAWNNADDGFDFLKCQAVVTADSCIAYANGKATYSDIKGNGNGIKAGGFGKAAFSASLEIPMHVVKNSISVRNRKSGFYSNHHLGGLQFEGNRAYDNNPDFNMMNRSKESLTETIPENSDPRMEVDGYDHLLSNNIVYRNSDFSKLITYTDPSKCTLVGNSFTYQNGAWTNKEYSEADFVSLAVGGLLKDRDAAGKLPDAVFDFMRLKNAGESVAEPTLTKKSEEDGKAIYTATYPTDAELHYKLPNDDTEYIKTGGSTDIEVTANGKLIAWVVKDSSTSAIVQLSILLTGAVVYDFANTTENINADDNSKKRTLSYSDTSASFRYVLNGSDRLRVLTYTSTGKFTEGTGLWLDGTNRPFAIEGVKAGDMIRVIHNGTITDANAASTGTTIADINGNAFTGEIASGKAIMVKTADADNDYVVLMATSKNLTISMLAVNHAIAPIVEKDAEQSGNGKYIYKVNFYEGETLHYTSPDTSEEKSINYNSCAGTATIAVTKDGELVCWTTYGATESEPVTKTIDFSIETATISVKSGYQTYYTEKALDLSTVDASELKAFIVTKAPIAATRGGTRASTAQLQLTEVVKVPDETALVLWSKKAGTIELPYATTPITAILCSDGTEVEKSVNLLKKAEQTEMASDEETIFLPNTEGTFYFEYSDFVTKGDIYLELSDLGLADDVKNLLLGSQNDDGTIIPLNIETTNVANATATLDEEKSSMSSKTYILTFAEGQTLFYMRPGQDTAFRKANYREGGVSIKVSNSGFLVFYTQDNTSKMTSKKNAVEVDISKSGSSSSDVVTIEAYDVDEKNNVVFYRLSWEAGSELRYILDSEGTEQSAGTSGTYELAITMADRIQAWTIQGNDTSKVVTAGLFMQLHAMTIKGNFDFAESSEELPVDMEVTLNTGRSVEIANQELFMPSVLTEKLFDDRFAFSEVTSKNKIRLRRNRTLMLSKGDDMKMAILNLKEGDIVALDYSGVIKMQNTTDAILESEATASTRASASELTIRSGKSYVMQHDGNLLLDVVLADSSVVINKVFAGSVPEISEPTAIDFLTAAEEFETIETGRPASVFYYNKEKVQIFRWLTNDSDNLPLDAKISTEGGNGTITTSGLTAGNRRLAIHNLSAGDEIKLRFSGGSVTYEGHDNGCVMTLNGKYLTPQDTLRSGDVIKVEKVNYLYNYAVLKLDSKVRVGGIYINTVETEKVSMPTIVDKGSNTVLITAGQSSTGKTVTTCYTTDGSEPSKLNGTSGPYDEIEVQLLSGGIITVKAVSFTDSGLYSRVASLTIFADEMTNGRDSMTRGVTGTYDMQGNKVETVSQGKLYIRDGKVVFFGKETK